jgi:hypothetical protein
MATVPFATAIAYGAPVRMAGDLHRSFALEVAGWRV